jgi:hypothetical protein
MTAEYVQYRRVLSVVVLTILVMLALPARNGVANSDTKNILISGDFKVDIPGCASAREIVSAEVDDIEIEMKDASQSDNQDWRTFVPGQPRYGEARFTFRQTKKPGQCDVSEWIADTLARGDAARRSITITLLDRKSMEARRYKLIDCLPVAWGPAGSLDLNKGCRRCTQSTDLAELVVHVGRIEIGLPADTGDESDTSPIDNIQRYKGFNVEIKGVDNAPTSVDGSWKVISGGAVMVESVEETVGEDGSRSYTPGKQYVSDLTLIGYMTGTRRALMTWMKNSAAGTGDLRADITVTPIKINGSPGPTYNYFDCMITHIKIPPLHAGSQTPIEEKLTIRCGYYKKQ